LKVYEALMDRCRTRVAHLTLIDPDKQEPEAAGRMARQAEDAGTDGIMIGGSTAEDPSIVDRTVAAIKENCSIPAILFPGGVQGLTPKADAIFYISLLNSEDPYFITGAHAETAHPMKELDLEVIPVGYLIVEPGQTVGRMGKARLIPRDKPAIASSYAIVAEYFGMKFVYLEAGSGADRHVPPEMISATRKSIGLPLIVGGGIRTLQDARRVSEAGANVIVQGTAMEEDTGANKRVADVIRYLRSYSA
jgi:phosphoglycerol geranylgeranyltransferase